MTTAIASARELHEHSSTFRCGIAEWVQERRCPLPLVDLLLEYGLEKQADCARWAATEPDRPVFPEPAEKHGERGGKCGPFPACDNGDNPEWAWFPRSDRFEMSHAFDVPEAMGQEAMDYKGPTPTDAILWLLDHWKPQSTS